MTTDEDPTKTMTDAQWAAEMATHALDRGRIELGYQLAKIAVQAQRHERAQSAKSALFGDADHSQPIPYVPAYTFDRLHEKNPVDGAAIGTAPVDAPLCEAHGQPMLAGLVGDDGKPEWHCVCTRGGVEKPIEHAVAQVDQAIEQLPAPPAQGRCVAEIMHVRGTEQFREPCRGPLYWTETPGAPGHTGRWAHVDPALDAQHPPLI
jgi:hypothetical protein